MIEIKFEDTGTGHKDLHLVIDKLGLRQSADSYYFANDSAFGEVTEEGTIIKGLEYLLNFWKKTIQNSTENTYYYLPFDFSDEYIGYLRIKRRQGDIFLDYGFSRKYSAPSPSISEEYALLEETDYQAKTETTLCTASEILNDIDFCIKKILLS